MASAINIFKYRLNSGDRILYTYSKFISYLKRQHPNALVLLQYEQHDDQGIDAKKYQLAKMRPYKRVTELVSELATLTEDYANSDSTISDETICDIFEMLDPSFAENSARFVMTEEMAANRNCTDWDVILVPHQNKLKLEFEQEKKPMLILGGAGSGKTVLATHVLGDFGGERAIYLTQSEELRNKTEKQFRGKYSDKDNVEFRNINDFCEMVLGYKDRDFFTYRDFQNFLSNDQTVKSIRENLNLSDFDIWTEIRGVIKGSLFPNWTRIAPLDQKNYKHIDYLVQKGYVIRPYNDKRFVLSGPVNEIKRRIEEDRKNPDILFIKDEYRELETILKYFSNFDSNLSLMPLESYLRLPSEYSTVEKENREALYKISVIYNDFLGGKRFDDNDLARMTIGRINDVKERYDLVVVDEVQDYTEMQLYLTFLLRLSDAILFTGDVHQLINPTMFRESRLKDLFYVQENVDNLKTRFLSANFRCQQGIVDVANDFAIIRRKTVGAMSAEGEQIQASKRQGSRPFRLEASKKNVQSICDTLINYPRTAILVPDDKTRSHLIGLIGEERYRAAKNSIIFTIPEIKGMEYRYVLCYNLFGSNSKFWDDIVFNKESSHQTRLRYYFNLIYVAITRAQDNLCFIDENVSYKVEQNSKDV